MGISGPLLDMHLAWAREGLLDRTAAVLDVGAQQLFCADDPESLNRFIAHFGGQQFSPDELKKIANLGEAGELFVRAGFTYQSIDIAPGKYVLTMDLNRDALAREYHGQYQWVANHGTSEHILNQWNVFQTMHDACAKGGFMYHNVPMCEPFHGILSYSPEFFWALADANNYRVVSMWAWNAGETSDVRDRFNFPFNGVAPFAPIWINVILERRNDLPFAGLRNCIPSEMLPFAARFVRRMPRLGIASRILRFINR